MFLHFHGTRYAIHAWCVMPNHAHVLFQPMKGWTMSRIVASWKMFSGRKINDWKRKNGLLTDVTGEDLNLQRAGQESGAPSGAPVWQREYFDRYIRDEVHYRNAVDYIHENPLKAGLTESPEQWPYSSAAIAATDGSQAIGP
jgi:REP element-mobilizing transposase RayT